MDFPKPCPVCVVSRIADNVNGIVSGVKGLGQQGGVSQDIAGVA